MSCSSPRVRPPALRSSEPARAERGPDLQARVGDADRERTAGLLADAVAAGYLRMDELDERLARTWSATTGAQLRDVESDLPAALRRDRARREAADQARAVARAGLRPHLASYVGVMVLLVAIWLLVGLTAGSWYPWPVWPALGWGIGVLGHVRAVRAPATPR